MTRYLVRRFLQLLPVLLAISVLSFSLLVAMPGDPLDMLILGNPNVTAEDIVRLRQAYGLDDPIHIRYSKWLWQIAQGNFGYSRTYHVPVMKLVLPALRNTLILSGLSLTLSMVVALSVGIYSVTHQYSIGDHLGTVFAFFGFSIPGFWFGLMAIIVFAGWLRWLPPGGIVSIDVGPGVIARAADRLKYLIMPACVLALESMAVWTRYMRSSLLEVIGQEYIRTARAKGLSERTVLYRHALKNALLPIITLIGNTIPTVFGGALIIEQVFSYLGMGRLLYNSILNNDFSVAMAILMFLAVLVVVCNLLADISYSIIDPRISYR